MTTTPSTTSTWSLLLLRLVLAWRSWVGGLVLVAYLVLALRLAGVLPAQVGGPLGPALTTVVRVLTGLSAALALGYVAWLGLVLGLRRRRARQPPRRGTLYSLALPRPQASTAAASSQAEVLAGVDPLRALVLALAADPATAGQVALELWTGPDGRVQWAVWVEDVGALPDTVQRLLLGTLPGAELRPLDDPLRQVSV